MVKLHETPWNLEKFWEAPKLRSSEAGHVPSWVVPQAWGLCRCPAPPGRGALRRADGRAAVGGQQLLAAGDGQWLGEKLGKAKDVDEWRWMNIKSWYNMGMIWYHVFFFLRLTFLCIYQCIPTFLFLWGCARINSESSTEESLRPCRNSSDPRPMARERSKTPPPGGLLQFLLAMCHERPLALALASWTLFRLYCINIFLCFYITKHFISCQHMLPLAVSIPQYLCILSIKIAMQLHHYCW